MRTDIDTVKGCQNVWERGLPSLFLAESPLPVADFLKGPLLASCLAHAIVCHSLSRLLTLEMLSSAP